NEYGATTGRPRRCGWIDLVALNYACMINGVTKIVMTKADVLDSFEDLQVCTAYTKGGETLKEIPLRLDLDHYVPVLEGFDGWHTDISQIKDFNALPDKAKSYIGFINKYLGVNVDFISN